MTDIPALIARLRTKAQMIHHGEKIAWGSDSAVMEEAAVAPEDISGAYECGWENAIEKAAKVAKRAAMETGCPAEHIAEEIAAAIRALKENGK